MPDTRKVDEEDRAYWREKAARGEAYQAAARVQSDKQVLKQDRVTLAEDRQLETRRRRQRLSL